MLGLLIDRFRASRVQSRSRYAAARRQIPKELFAHWKRTAPAEFPAIPVSAYFYASATEGLLSFFECAARSPNACALPSKAADSVWHAWSRYSQSGLDAFCKRQFGKVIPHVEAGAMAGDMDLALATCLAQARKQSKLSTASPTVPMLFALDKRLKMPGGYAYRVDNGKVGFMHMDGRGAPAGPMNYPSSLDLDGLLAAGLVSAGAYAFYMRQQGRKPDPSTAGASCGSDCGSACASGGDGGDSGERSGSDGSACSSASSASSDSGGGSSCSSGSSCGSSCSSSSGD
ncbi:MAG: hypothetical protein V4582_22545 [Pseudomonadota bacterium]